MLVTRFEYLNINEKFSINWTEEIFIVDEVLDTNPVTYRLVDLQGEAVSGSFYEQELQRTTQEVF